MGERSRIHEERWLVVLAALAVYEAFYLIGGFLESKALNTAGVGAFLVVLLVGTPGAPHRQSTNTLRFAAVPLIALLVASVMHPANTALYHLSKFALFYVLILIFSTILPYSVEQSRFFNVWRLLIICPIAASLLLGRSQDVFGDVRTAGLFVNANSFALMAFLIPAVLPASATRTQRAIADAAALAVIVVSGTSGALVSYLCAAILTRLGTRSLVVLGAAVVTLAVIITVYRDQVIAILAEHKATERVALQAQAVMDASANVRTGAVDFGRMSQEYGGSALSGVWRLVHWLDLWERYRSSGLDVQAFGFGPGSTHMQFDRLPHNDYLRVLYEQGAFGLGALILFYGKVLRGISRHYKPLVIGFLLYSATENNIDNFLFMSMFAVIIATNTVPRQMIGSPSSRGG